MATDKATPDEGVTAATPRPGRGRPDEPVRGGRRGRTTSAAGAGSSSSSSILLVAACSSCSPRPRCSSSRRCSPCSSGGRSCPSWTGSHEAPRQARAGGCSSSSVCSSCSPSPSACSSCTASSSRCPTIDAKLNTAWADIQKSLKSTSVSQDRSTRSRPVSRRSPRTRPAALAGTLVDLIGGVGEPHLRRLHQPQHPRVVPDPGTPARQAGRPSGWGRCRRPSPTTSSPTARGSSAATSTGARSWACSTAP